MIVKLKEGEEEDRHTVGDDAAAGDATSASPASVASTAGVCLTVCFSFPLFPHVSLDRRCAAVLVLHFFSSTHSQEVGRG